MFLLLFVRKLILSFSIQAPFVFKSNFIPRRNILTMYQKKNFDLGAADAFFWEETMGSRILKERRILK
jgi:hypothetical protein